jgi:hypothetical protein
VARLSPRQRAVALAAWAAGAPRVAWLLERGEIPASEGVAFVAAAGWLSALAWRGWRAWLLDLTRLALARAGWIVLGLTAAGVLAVSMFNSLGPLCFGIGGGLALAAGVAFSLAVARDRRGALMRLGVLALNLALLAAVDGVARVALLPKQRHNKLFIQHDADLGWRLTPGLRVKRETDEYVSAETINSWGFRTPEIAIEKPAGTKRVVVVGDSHTEGYTVNDDETYARHLERLLSAAGGPVQVVSLGAGGYSTDQEFLAYVRCGRRLKPDVVVLQICENDIRFNTQTDYWRGRKPVFRRHGDLLLLEGTPVPDERGTGLFSPDLLQKSALVVLLESALRNLAVGDRSRPDANWDEGWAVTRLLVRDFAAAAARDGARLAAFNVNAGDPKMAWMDRRLRDICGEFGVPYLETAAVYRDAFASYWVAGHWNRKGHLAAAETLAPQLRALLDGAPPPEAKKP